MEWVISLLTFFGITSDKYPFLVLAILVVGGVVYIRVSIGNQLEAVNDKLGKVKDNVLVVVTHLATSRTARLDANLIRAMSPLFIQPAGHIIIEESGLKKVMDDSVCRKSILKYIEDMRPATKLDVEQKSIVLFETILQNNYMNPIKKYLYEKPDMRDVMPTLAGLYIRDEYLKEHPEIAD